MSSAARRSGTNCSWTPHDPRGSLRCAWNLPSYAKGRMLRGVILASTGGSEVTRTFALRVR